MIRAEGLNPTCKNNEKHINRLFCQRIAAPSKFGTFGIEIEIEDVMEFLGMSGLRAGEFDGIGGNPVIVYQIFQEIQNNQNHENSW